MHTIIIGGGWAGLSAAITLCSLKKKVTLLEAGKTLGGRARTIRYRNTSIDNGQHLIIGAYQNFLALLKVIDINESTIFYRQRPYLRVENVYQKRITINFPGAKFPFNILFGFLSAKGLSVKERLSLVRFSQIIQNFSQNKSSDIPVIKLLKYGNQSENLINNIWAPLCLAMLNTDINKASAMIFSHSLLHTFKQKNQNTDFLIPKKNLGDVFPEPAKIFINNNGGSISCSARVKKLVVTNNEIQGVVLQNNKIIESNKVIIATSHQSCAQLFRNIPSLRTLSKQLKGLGTLPIVTIYLQFKRDCQLNLPFLALTDSLAQWVFDRRYSEQHGLMAFVISGLGEHLEMSNETLIQNVSEDFSLLFPNWGSPKSAFVIREKRATFSCHAEINKTRPDHTTPVDGLFLAGDYTKCLFPATLESAIFSGKTCANKLL